MSTFEETRGMMVQQHFTVVEIDLPVVEGVCTISGESGFGTELSCDQPSNATRTYKFTDVNAPSLTSYDPSNIYRCIKAVNETTTKLKSGRGLSGRGFAKVVLNDFDNADPNPDAPAVTDEIKKGGTFFGKLDARQVMQNKEVRIKNYRIQPDGTIDLINGAETRYYLVKSFNKSKKGSWTLNLKDELARVNINQKVWPTTQEGFLRLDVDDTVLTFPVDANTSYAAGQTVRIGDELIKISSVANIGTASATITTLSRGTPIDYTNRLSLTDKDSHDAGDEVFICYVSDNQNIDDLLYDMVTDIGIDPSLIPVSDWANEIAEWHPNNKINTLWIESAQIQDFISKVLTEYMIDMWFDPVDRELKISTISAWQESTSELFEGREINYDTVVVKKEESLRCTRSLVVYDKRKLPSPDSIENYKKGSLFKRVELESEALYGEAKVKRFENSFLLDEDAADLLVNRYVNRYINPQSYRWITPERFLNFKVGDVVDITTASNVGFAGTDDKIDRVQITSINPVYKVGRTYNVEALSYEPVFGTGVPEIVITGSITNINLYIQYAGAPSQATEITFIFDNVTGIGSSNTVPAIQAGAFPAGSKINFIMVNGTDLQGLGGRGGFGQSLEYDFESSRWIYYSIGNGQDGGVVYDAQGVETDIYFSGATPSAAYPLADGYIRAPSGGDGGFKGTGSDGNSNSGNAGGGGNAGSGRNAGVGGAGGDIVLGGGNSGSSGTSGTSTGNWGLDGVNNNAIAGTKGSGVVDSGGTVTFFGSTATRYINGNGDH